MPSDLLVLLDTNIFIAREGHRNVPHNVATLFRQLDEQGIKFVLHVKSYKDIFRYENVERRKSILSKFSCYSPLKAVHDFSTDSRFLNTIKTTSPVKESDYVDNALLYEVYKGTVTHLVTEDRKKKESIHAKARKLGIKDKVLSIDEAISKFKQKTGQKKPFLSWEAAWTKHVCARVLSATVELTARNEELTKTRSMVDNPQVNAIILTGQHGIGKTRIALEATRHRKNETCVIDFDSSEPASLSSLLCRAPRNKRILLLDNTHPKMVEAITNELRSGSGFRIFRNVKLLIASPDQLPVPTQDRRIGTVEQERIAPLSDNSAFELLTAAQAKLEYNVQLWLVQNAGGIPEILLEGVSSLAGHEQDVSDFANKMELEAETIAYERLSDDEITKLKLLSLIKKIGVKESAFGETEVICKLFGNERICGKNVTAESIVEALPRLENTGFIQLKGSYAEFHSQFLANRFAKNLIRGHTQALKELFFNLKPSAQEQLVNRMSALRGEFAGFWKFLFSKKEFLIGTKDSKRGPLSDFQAALVNNYLLFPVACARPSRVLQLIASGLEATSVEDRKTIAITARNEMAHALQEALFHRTISQRAAISLALLAEAEAGTSTQSATAAFCNYFYPHHPQVSVSLNKRLEILRNLFFSANLSAELRNLGISAIEVASSHRVPPLIWIHSSAAATPLDPPFRTYTGAQLDYVDSLIDILMQVADNEVQESMLTERALTTLLRANIESMASVLKLISPERRPERIIDRFKILTEWALARKPLSVSELDSALDECHGLLNADVVRREKVIRTDIKEAPEFSKLKDYELDEHVADVQRSASRIKAYANEIQAIRNKLHDASPFSIRLRMWVGSSWSPEEHMRRFDAPAKRYGLYEEPRALAKEVLATPLLLADDDLMSWLCSDRGKRANIFFNELGKLDAQHRFIDVIARLSMLGTKHSVENFASYFAGLNEVDNVFVSAQLEKFLESGQIQMETALEAIALTGYSATHYERIKQLLEENAVDPVVIVQLALQGPWITGLKEEDCYQIMKLVAGPMLLNAPLVIHYLKAWNDVRGLGKGDLAQLAWSCFEVMPCITNEETYDFDLLASALAEMDRKRGFDLLKRALEYPPKEHTPEEYLQPNSKQPWNPLSSYEPHRLWNTLWRPDHQFALRFVLQIGASNPKLCWRVKSGLLRVIDQGGDADILVALARENQKQAELVCYCITTYKKRSFCKIAFGILEFYPFKDKIEDALIFAFSQLGGGFVQESRTRLETQLERIATLTDDPNLSEAVKEWLNKLEPNVRRELEFSINTEYQ
jgi:hypothetical protein